MGMVGTVAYKPVGLVAGAAAGLLAGVLFKQVWRGLSGEDEAPGPTDEDRGWAEILIAATLQGAIFGLVRAAVDRGGAVAVRRTTGDWPD
jgi:Protein of unknown function (DUF4235)